MTTHIKALREEIIKLHYLFATDQICWLEYKLKLDVIIDNIELECKQIMKHAEGYGYV